MKAKINLEDELNYKRLLLDNKATIHREINDKVINELLEKITKQENLLKDKQKEIDLCKSSNLTINVNQVQNNNCNMVNNSIGNSMAQSDYLTFSLNNENNSNCFDTLNHLGSFQKNEDNIPYGSIRFNNKPLLDIDANPCTGNSLITGYADLKNIIDPNSTTPNKEKTTLTQDRLRKEGSFRKGEEFLGRIKQDNKSFNMLNKDNLTKSRKNLNKEKENFDKLNKSPLPVKVFPNTKNTETRFKEDKLCSNEIENKKITSGKISNPNTTRNTSRQISKANTETKLKGKGKLK